MQDDTNDPTPQQPEPRRRKGVLGRRAAMAVTAAGLLGGAFAGGFIVTNAATPAATPSASTTTPATGTFHPNENATHEAGESATHEAQENAGQMPTVP